MKHIRILLLLIFSTSYLIGCNKNIIETNQTNPNPSTSSRAQNIYTESENIAQCYKDIFTQASNDNKLETLEFKQKIINCLGKAGFAATDTENQIDMVNPNLVEQFCKTASNQQEGEVTILRVLDDGGFVRLDLHTVQGNIEVESCSLYWEDNCAKADYYHKFTAYTWSYSEKGYLFFEEYHMSGYDGAPGQTAIRVKPLDEACRELNRKYVMPIGYERNNLLITDWSETNFGELDFYDLYDIISLLKYSDYVPYEADNQSPEYEIPKDEFEEVIKTYFQIDSSVLEKNAVYYADTQTYRYRPRGLYDAEFSYEPYPEVTAYERQEDGTLMLTVEAVWEIENLDQAFTSELVVRPLENGGFQYVSNHVLSMPGNTEPTWYQPRLTAEEWQEYYGGLQHCFFTREEKQRLQNDALSAAEQAREVYKNIELSDDDLNYASNIKDFTPAQCKEVVSLLGNAGYVSVTDDCNMENPEKIEEFYSAYLEGREGMVTIFNVNRDGLIGAMTLLYRENELQTYYVGIGWKEEGIPELKSTLVSDVAEIKLTEKGYFIYAFETIIEHAGLRQYWRTKPLSDKCRELTEKYISGLSYVNYNMLVTDWDSNNVEDVLMPCMFEDIYRIYTGEILKTENGVIPAGVYEEIMTACFPVSISQLREKCGYDENSGSYPYEMILAVPYPPFGEVIDYSENADGTITLIVDGVWPDYNSDCAFTNKIVVQPFENGTFRYLSNSIEQKELEIPLIAKKKG